MNFNKVILSGNITRDIQLKYLQSQTAIAEFGIAINRKFKSASGDAREEVTFLDVMAFGKTGEIINQYFSKGKPIFIEGRLNYSSWEDKNGGGKRSKITVVVENFQFVGGPGGGGDPGEDQTAEQRRPASRPPARRPDPRQREMRPEQPFGDELVVDEADIPF